jgi:hypothetical protein
LDDATHSHDAAATVNGVPTAPLGAFNHPETLYQAQTDGNPCEIKGSIMYRNQRQDPASGLPNPEAYTDAETVGVFAPENNNLREPANSPIQSIAREAPPVAKVGGVMARVTSLDPRAANAAVTHPITPALDDGFYTSVPYVGAFGPNENWLIGWSAADEFGLLVLPPAPAPPAPPAAITQ